MNDGGWCRGGQGCNENWEAFEEWGHVAARKVFAMAEGRRPSNGHDGKGELVIIYGEKVVALPKTQV